MESGLELERSNLARIALAAWVNVDPDKLPADKMWIEHPNDDNRKAWDRVVAAILVTRAPSDAALVEALEEVMGVAELYVPVPLSAPGFKRARAALAAAKGQQPALDRNTVNGDEDD